MKNLQCALVIALGLGHLSAQAWWDDYTTIDGLEIRMPNGPDGACEFFAAGKWRDEYDAIVVAARAAHNKGHSAQEAAKKTEREIWEEEHPIQAEYGPNPYWTYDP